MKIKTTIIMSMLGFLFGCVMPTKNVLYVSECNGLVLKLSVVESPKFDVSDFKISIEAGKLPAITITPLQVYDQTPYSFAILNNYPHQLYDTTIRTTPFGDITTTKNRMIIFIDPKKYSRQDFDQINTCLSKNSEAMEKALYDKYINVPGPHHFNYPQFAGIVYANISDFSEEYISDDGSKKVMIVFSGEVLFYERNHKKVAGSLRAAAEADTKNLTAYHPKDESWLQLKNTKTGRRIAEDYTILVNAENRVYWFKK